MASKKNTRSASQAEQDQEIQQALKMQKQLMQKRSYSIEKFVHLRNQIDDDQIFNGWSKALVEEKLQFLQDRYDKIETNDLRVECDVEMETQEERKARIEENNALETDYLACKSKMRARIGELSPVVSRQPNQEKMQIEVQSANIENTWGTFNGEYENWQRFHDLFKAGVHENNRVKTIFKFQMLQAACVGEAKGALGEWNLIEANYEKAWNRLKSIYEDNYMQVQSYMRKLHNLPRMQNSGSKDIRDLIDTVHQCIHGLSRYIGVEGIDPFVVFLVIDRMDRDAYRAWEKFRPTLKGEGENATPGKYIPKWNELEQFLETEVTIRVHEEKRREVSSNFKAKQNTQAKQEKNRFPHQNKYAQQLSNKSAPDFLNCKLCSNIHPIYKCDVFKAMNFAGRKDYVIQANLCYRCLRPNHGDTECNKSEPCKPCPKCPQKTYHNSWLCPTKEADIRSALLAVENESKKAKAVKRTGEPNI